MSDRSEYLKEWYAKNREKKLASNRQWRLANQKRMRELIYRWRSSNPEAIQTIQQRYDASRPESRAEQSAIRRARKLGAFVEAVDREVVFLNDTGICQWQYCQEASPFVDPTNWHLDHIVPLSKGGEHSYANSQVMHPVCNLKKGAS